MSATADANLCSPSGSTSLCLAASGSSGTPRAISAMSASEKYVVGTSGSGANRVIGDAFFAAKRRRRPRLGVESARLPTNDPSVFENRDLSRRLVTHRAKHRTRRVEVLDLAPLAQLGDVFGGVVGKRPATHGDVDVRAQRSVLHVRVSTSRKRTARWNASTAAAASSADRRSGRVTISTRAHPRGCNPPTTRGFFFFFFF